MGAHGQGSLASIEGVKPMSGASGTALPPGFRSSLLAGLKPPEIEAVVAAATRRSISAKQVIYREGDPATHMFLLVAGGAARYKLTPEGGKLFLCWLGAGDVFGFMTLRT